MPDDLTHLDTHGNANMVNVGHKPITQRYARAEGYIYMQPQTLTAIQQGNLKKGDVFSTARIAGIMAAKKTSDLIPLCHPLPINKIALTITPDEDQSAIRIIAEVHTTGQTGLEMEALTAVQIATLTIYDMAKALDRSMTISNVRLLDKTGGTHGDYHTQDTHNED